MRYRISGILVLLAFITLLGAKSVYSSWLIDPARFHASAHGQLSCQECHEQISSKKLHPDPTLVGKPRSAFFDREHCLVCHDEIEENLENGLHGRKRITDRKKYGHCIRCHKPHYQMRLGENRIGHFKEGIPKYKQCSACHEAKDQLPPFSEDDAACITCHLKKDITQESGRESANALCLHCHGQGSLKASQLTSKAIGLIDLQQYNNTAHSQLACLACHVSGAAFNHDDQRSVDCLRCHRRHDAKKAHDAHLTVRCGACHLSQVRPRRDNETKNIVFEVIRRHSGPLRVHDIAKGVQTCTRCHFKGNDLGAPASILPAKSIICMGCHVSTFSIGDTTTLVSLGIFFVGLLLALSYFLSGGISHSSDDPGAVGKFFICVGKCLRSLFSKRFPIILKTIALDVLLQRRLYRRSEARWWIHALIFYPFLFRFVWGMVGLLGSLWSPSSEWVWAVVDKNNMITAFCFDLSGALLLLGVILALARETLARLRRRISLPEQDPWSLLLIGGIVIVGFLLEGIRMAMTGLPGNAEYGLIGYWISGIFSGVNGLTSLYVYVWYIHAILVGAFVAYIPFSRLFHIVMAPITLAINAGKGEVR